METLDDSENAIKQRFGGRLEKEAALEPRLPRLALGGITAAPGFGVFVRGEAESNLKPAEGVAHQRFCARGYMGGREDPIDRAADFIPFPRMGRILRYKARHLVSNDLTTGTAQLVF